VRVAVHQAAVDPDRAYFDVAERKGIGHPDTLADLVADAFSARYSQLCLERFDAIPNHWVDKVALIGAQASVRYGGFSIEKPITCYLFGKVTSAIGGIPLHVADVFESVVADVLPAAARHSGIGRHVRCRVENTAGTAVDHPASFYRPSSRLELPGSTNLAEPVASNDTTACLAMSRLSAAARLALSLEADLTDWCRRANWPFVGTDIKAMVVRTKREWDVTIAVPFHPELVPDRRAYFERRAEVGAVVSEVVARALEASNANGAEAVRVHLNTKDDLGGAYLAPFGTSLGKGDCGLVGRGNRTGGVIQPLLGASGDAPAGKNPVHHAGRLHAWAARAVARAIDVATGSACRVTIVSQNGMPIDTPHHVLVELNDEVDVDVAFYRDLIEQTMAGLPRATEDLVDGDVIARHDASALLRAADIEEVRA
jgi:S-adenosylmethionine synthetase